MSTDLALSTGGAGPHESGAAGLPNAPVKAFWKVDPLRPNEEFLRPVLQLLSRGGVIVYPTETFYGLGGNPVLAGVVERVYRIKGRETGKPLPLMASNLQAVLGAVADWPGPAEKLAEVFWPGPLTLVLPAASHILPEVHGGTGKIGIRISSHPVSRILAAGVGGLLIATSANKAHERPFQISSEIPETFLSLVDGLVDAGPSPEDCRGLPSTIVDACSCPPKLIRAGCIAWERVLQAIDSFK